MLYARVKITTADGTESLEYFAGPYIEGESFARNLMVYLGNNRPEVVRARIELLSSDMTHIGVVEFTLID